MFEFYDFHADTNVSLTFQWQLGNLDLSSNQENTGTNQRTKYCIHRFASFFISASWRSENTGRSHFTWAPTTFLVGLAASGSMANFSASDLTTLFAGPAISPGNGPGPFKFLPCSLSVPVAGEPRRATDVKFQLNSNLKVKHVFVIVAVAVNHHFEHVQFDHLERK